MDGLEATRAIRRREAESPTRLPILAMTASSSIHDIQRCFTAGMDGFVEKPVRQAQLFRTINELMAAGQHRAPAVDWPLALQQASGQHEQLQERVTLLRQELPRLQQDLAAAAAARNFMALTIAAHTLKVALASFGAPRLAEIARQLESIGKQPDALAVDEALASFQQESELVQRALDQFSGTAAS
jgi:two-component system sensor histidine kinase/response regulator